MTTVYPISGGTPAKQPNDPTASTPANNQLNQQTFLRLLVAQIQYQDPMSPADPTTYLTQTAQFTQVEALQNMLKSQEASQASSQMLAASSMIGRAVTFSLSPNGQAIAPTPTTVENVAGTLPKDAAVGAKVSTQTNTFTDKGVKIPITLEFTKTAAGWKVQPLSGGRALGDALPLTFDASGTLTSGDVSITASALNGVVGTAGDWPPTGIKLSFGEATDPTRLQLSTGTATLAVMEQNGNDGLTATGVVTGMHITADGPVLIINGQEVPYASVTDVHL